jgi:hypothetical protein
MNQRVAKMKPASFMSHDNPTIRVHSLVKFLHDAQLACEAKGEEDSALRFECFKEWLEQDYKPGQTFQFSKTAIGM